MTCDVTGVDGDVETEVVVEPLPVDGAAGVVAVPAVIGDEAGAGAVAAEAGVPTVEPAAMTSVLAAVATSVVEAVSVAAVDVAEVELLPPPPHDASSSAASGARRSVCRPEGPFEIQNMISFGQAGQNTR
jgi:hypothetical protein